MDTGETVAQRFEILRLARSGGMGRVYQARDRVDGAVVALKVLLAGGKGDVDRFVREAQVLAELKHPGIVRYVAHGQTPAGEAYLAMEWLEGESLADRLARQPLTAAESVTLATQVAQALSVAHARGVIHRDIKPSNLLLPEGRIEDVKVLDFGIARTRALATGTGTGTMIGTPGYMSPEQARGARDLDARADVFALGCVLFECLAGRAAFVADHVMAVLAKILIEEVPRVAQLAPRIAPELDALVARMMAKERSARPKDGAAVALALRDVGVLGEGAAQLAEGESVPSALTAGEQRLLSVVIARGAARSSDELELSPTLTPEQADFMVPLREVVKAHGGSVEQVADGSVVVTLMGTGAATDQAAAGARCALAIRGIMPRGPMALATGRGIVHGSWPVGDVIERAVRLLRPPGADETTDAPAIWIDDVTAGLLDVGFDVGGDAAGLVLRGQREQIEATRTLLGKPSPFVGREREISVLMGLFEECAAEPTARAILVTGPAGVGKSRLRYEFIRKLKARGAAVEVWMGRGDPISAGSPFGLIAPALRRSAGILDGEPLALRQQKVRARVARHIAGEDAGRITAFIGELVGAPLGDDASVQLRAARLDAMLMGDQIRRAWQDFVAAECAAQPVVVVLEDLHWGDLPTVKLLDAALRHVERLPFMVLALARPEVHDLFPSLWQDRALEQIRLRELTRGGSEKLVKHVLGKAATPEMVERLVAQAAGNAFYLEELLRAVAEGKGDVLPETVLSMVHARLERLEPQARRVLRAASIFGQVFWEGGVKQLLGGAERGGQVVEWLRDLVDREVVARRGDGKFPGQPEYIFRHALLREAAYATLTLGDRELGHRLAGEWLESVGDSEAVVLGEHFERGGAPARAVAWYRRAAEQALEGNDMVAAVARADRGLACDLASDTRSESLGALRLIQAEAHRWRGGYADAEACAMQAMSLIRRGSPQWFSALAEVAASSGRLGHHTELERLAETVLALGKPDRPGGPHVAAPARLATQLIFGGRVALADRLLEHVESIEASVVGDNPASDATLRQLRAARALCAGDPGAYLEHSRVAVTRFEQVGDLRNAYNAGTNVGHALIELGSFADADRALREVLAGSERMGLANVIAYAHNNLGLAQLCAGRLEDARVFLGRAVVEALAQGNRRLEGYSRIYLARALRAAGDLAGAGREAEAAMEVLATTPPARACALATLAAVRLAQGDAKDALAGAREAMGILGALGEIEEGEPAIRLVHAEALHATGDVAGARAAIGQAKARILERAEKIAEPSWRKSFLENVPDNARTLALAATW